jgi:hypothetical protein
MAIKKKKTAEIEKSLPERHQYPKSDSQVPSKIVVNSDPDSNEPLDVSDESNHVQLIEFENQDTPAELASEICEESNNSLQEVSNVQE